MAFARFAGAAAVSIFAASPNVARADEPPTFADRADEEVRSADRRLGLLLDPLAATMGLYGGEADFVVANWAALAVEGDFAVRAGRVSHALGVGLLLFPLGAALHGLYLQPRVAYARPWDEGLWRFDWSEEALGFGGSAGWQWTWDYGFTVRVGGGALYFAGGPRSGSEGPVALGPRAVLDGSFGWAF